VQNIAEKFNPVSSIDMHCAPTLQTKDRQTDRQTTGGFATTYKANVTYGSIVRLKSSLKTL